MIDWGRLVGKFYFDSELEFPKKNLGPLMATGVGGSAL